MFDENVVGVTEVIQDGVLLQRQGEMARVHSGAAMQTRVTSSNSANAGKPDERIGDLGLGVAVRGNFTTDAGDHTDGPGGTGRRRVRFAGRPSVSLGCASPLQYTRGTYRRRHALPASDFRTLTVSSFSVSGIASSGRT